MNTRPLSPSCRTCRGEGYGEGYVDGGSGERPAKPLRAGVIAALCLGAAVVGYCAPVAWWTT